MGNKNIERCYYCAAPKETREHVPPKQMFKAFYCDRITVPSCRIHNTIKGMQDQAIVSGLLLPLYNAKNKYPLEEEVIQAIEAALPSFERAKHNAISSPFLNNPPLDLEDLPDVSFLSSAIDVATWGRQLTAALVCDALGWLASSSIRWSKADVWSPDRYGTGTPDPKPFDYSQAVQAVIEHQNRKKILDQQDWIEGWSAFPIPYPKNIYSFHISFEPGKVVWFRHKFYNRYTLYVSFKASTQKIIRLRKKINSWSKNVEQLVLEGE